MATGSSENEEIIPCSLSLGHVNNEISGPILDQHAPDDLGLDMLPSNSLLDQPPIRPAPSDVSLLQVRVVNLSDSSLDSVTGLGFRASCSKPSLKRRTCGSGERRLAPRCCYNQELTNLL